MTKSKLPVVQEIQKEVTKQLANKEVMMALISTAFKGLSEPMVKQALVEGYMRGLTLEDFLKKHVYAIAYGSGYTLVTSIDYARKIGAKNGIVDILEPVYKEEEGKIISCTIIVKKKIGDYIGSFASTVYFDEYNTNRNQWTKMPHTMIAKVAEMASLRKACPEDLSQEYVQEEMEKEVEPAISDDDLVAYQEQLESAQTLEELKSVFAALPFEAKQKLEAKKDELKKKLK